MTNILQLYYWYDTDEIEMLYYYIISTFKILNIIERWQISYNSIIDMIQLMK